MKVNNPQIESIDFLCSLNFACVLHVVAEETTGQLMSFGRTADVFYSRLKKLLHRCLKFEELTDGQGRRVYSARWSSTDARVASGKQPLYGW